MNTVIIFCAKYLIFLVALFALGYWITLPRKQKLKAAAFGVITIVIAFILAKVGGSIFYDARPFVSDHVAALFKYTADNGFPSDHALVTASIAAAILTISRKWGIGLFILAIIIGTARVLAHIHHPIDILGSLVFVGIGSLVAYYLVPKLLSRLYDTKTISNWLKPNNTKTE